MNCKDITFILERFLDKNIRGDLFYTNGIGIVENMTDIP